MQCPKCGSKALSRLYSSFYVPVDENGEDPKNFGDHYSSTELTDAACCADCGHEFDWGDAEE